MPLATSLLTAIVRADGDALVLHAGERPYVVSPTGQSELASRALTLEAVKGMLNELLPAEARHTLDEIGAVQYSLAPLAIAPDQTFTVVAARGGDDIWIEIRRHRMAAPVDVTPAPEVVQAVPSPVAEIPEPSQPEPMSEPLPEEDPLKEPAFVPVGHTFEAETAVPEVQAAAAPDGESAAEPAYRDPGPSIEQVEEVRQETYDIGVPAEVHELSLDMHLTASDDEAVAADEAAGEAAEVPAWKHAASPEALVAHEAEPEPAIEAEPEITPEPRQAVVVPLSRHQARGDQGPRFTPSLQATGIDRLLRIAAAHGASTLYLTSQARPSMRVGGRISPIDGENALSEGEVEALILDMIPERNREALRSQAGTEWICDVPEVGRIRCVTFRDHRGAGGIFRMIPARAISAEHLDLSRDIQGLCAEADGLVLVAGPRASGKSTLLSAFVDLINRTRSDHVITIENQIRFVHENRGSLISQREVRGDRSELLAVARAALREGPDVLVVEDFGSPDIVALALEAAQSGLLVIGGLTAHTATDAVFRIIDQTPAERRAKVQQALAENLRGIVAQVLLRKISGGRVAAREVLLNSSAVANLIAEGKTSQLPVAIDSGRKHGMVAMNDALVSFVQGGIVDSREAYRHAADQQGFLALLKRQGIDASFVERLA